MHNLKAPPFATESTRSLLKTQYKKVYSICRLFANNYKEHQRLFAGIIAATAQSIKRSGAKEDKNTLLLQACINMAALHSLTREMEGSPVSVPGLSSRTMSGSTVIRTMTGPRAGGGVSGSPGGMISEGATGGPAGGTWDGDHAIQFKSPDYQKSMVNFRQAMGELSDYQKILLFLHFENVAAAEVPRLSGLAVVGRTGPEERIKKSFIPYLKEN
jgi:hypothetical protein